MAVDIIGTGESLIPQLITIIAIILSVELWLYIYKKINLREYRKLLFVPVALWLIFGTLDILVTISGTFENSSLEGNPAMKYFFEQFGILGAPIASFLWISLWAGIVAVILYLFDYLKKEKIGIFVSIVIFYSLSIGHLWGASTWLGIEPVQGILNIFYGEMYLDNSFIGGILPISIGTIVPGLILGGIHSIIRLFVENKQKKSNRCK